MKVILALRHSKIALAHLARLAVVVVFQGKSWSQTQGQTDHLVLVLIMTVWKEAGPALSALKLSQLRVSIQRGRDRAGQFNRKLIERI
jgi:hypothetical protein